MNDAKMIARLRDLRRLREQRAKETVMRRISSVQRAQNTENAAARATAVQREETASAETVEFGSIVGRQLDVQAMQSLQGRFQKASEDLVRLREAEKQAADAVQEEKKVLSGAREDHRRQLRRVTKLDAFLEELSSGPAHRRPAREELDDEEAAAEHGNKNNNG